MTLFEMIIIYMHLWMTLHMSWHVSWDYLEGPQPSVGGWHGGYRMNRWVNPCIG